MSNLEIITTLLDSASAFCTGLLWGSCAVVAMGLFHLVTARRYGRD